jgi:hypothetical protein
LRKVVWCFGGLLAVKCVASVVRGCRFSGLQSELAGKRYR